MVGEVNTPSQEQLHAAQTIMNNAGYNAATVVQMRLDMNPEIANFQKFLLGLDSIIDIDQATGEAKEVVVKQGERLVNDLGYQALMRWISFVTNKHTFMGNFLDEDWYNNYMCDLHKDVFMDLLVNRHKYGIEFTQLKPITHSLMMFARLVLTRPIGDKERIGMNNTTRIEERSQTNTASKGGGFGLPLWKK